MQHVFSWILGGSDTAKLAANYLADASLSSYGQYLQQQIDATVSSLTSMFTFGGTSLLIVVGVAIETFREIEAQLTMRNYKGFL